MSLPPLIRDPSGKTYVAIPAPSFVLGQNITPQSQILNSVPGYVYVEYSFFDSPGSPWGTVSLENNEINTSIGSWMTKNLSAEPPPGHIPWIGEISPLSTSCSSSTSICEHACLPEAMHNAKIQANSSISTFQLSSLCSDDALLKCSLPSACSSAWSVGLIPPPISMARSSGKASRRGSVPTSVRRKSRSSTKIAKSTDNRRYTICVQDVASRREARVFSRRLTMEKPRKDRAGNSLRAGRALSGDRLLSQIDKLDDFFLNGLKKMDSSMLHLNEEQVRLATPSLVVSSSSAIRPISVESYEGLRCAPSTLAQRRGKDIPTTLKLGSCAQLLPTALDYPDIPTPFRGSPEPMSETFSKAPRNSSKHFSKMTAEQMINSLMEQVDSFQPKHRASGGTTDLFLKQCKDAETWLEGELSEVAPALQGADNRQSHATDVCSRGQGGLIAKEYSPLVFPVPIRQIGTSLQSQISLPSTPKGQKYQPPTDGLNEWNAITLDPNKAKPRKSILSTGSSSTHGSKKTVRFSTTPPSVISPRKNSYEGPVSSQPTCPVPISPPKRKPAPSASPFESPVRHTPLPPTPMKSSRIRKPSPLSPIAQSVKTTPLSRPASRSSNHLGLFSIQSKPPKATTPLRNSTLGTSPKKGPLIFRSSPSTPKSKEDVDKTVKIKKQDRRLSLGASLKDGRDRSLSDKLATITKRRSCGIAGDDADKENKRGSEIVALVAREAKKKNGRRSLPFQNVLSRLRG